jgi:hypothetical protein
MRQCEVDGKVQGGRYEYAEAGKILLSLIGSSWVGDHFSDRLAYGTGVKVDPGKFGPSCTSST